MKVIYLLIFIFKIVEDALSTLRLIVVSNGKKKFGAILQVIIAVIWVLVTGSVISNINEDFFKIVVFALGSFVGSYLGSILEEKIALGTNMFTFSISKNNVLRVLKKLDGFLVLKLYGYDNKVICLVAAPRKNTTFIINEIKSVENTDVLVQKIKVGSDLV